MSCLKLSYFHSAELKIISSKKVLTSKKSENKERSGYMFGFNGQMKVNEIAGVGNHNTAEFWEYDTRLGRRWNLDPVFKEYESSYLALGGNPILFIDPNGDDIISIAKETGKIKIKKAIGNDVIRLVDKNQKIVNNYTYGKNGTFNNEVSLNQSTKITTMVSKETQKMQKIYIIMSESDVEFAKIDVEKNNKEVSVIVTSHDKSTNTAQPGMVTALAKRGFKGKKVSHNHPGGQPVPSGYYDQKDGNPFSLTPIRKGEEGHNTGDAENARVIRTYSGWENTKFEVVTEDYTTSYDGENKAVIEKNGTPSSK